MNKKIDAPTEIYKIASTLHNAGYECYLVGGAVRDQLLGKEAKDWDLTTNALPQQVIKLFKHVIPTGIKHGTVTIIFKGYQVEVTTYRVDGKYTDGRRPDKISFSPSIEEDLKRRDFTINSIAFNLNKKELFDPNKGLDDLREKKIRAIGISQERFNEDGLRSIRACRFAAQLNFTVTPKTFDGIVATKHRIPGLSKERIYDELMKIMKGADKPSLSFELFRDTGILEIIIPELYNCIGVTQKGSHAFDVFEHSIYACDGIPKSEPELRIAAILHDIGKPVVKEINNGEATFHNHEAVSEKMAREIMLRYRFSNNSIKKISHLVGLHMFHYEPQWTDSAVRRLIAKVGVENLNDLYILRQGDIWGTAQEENNNVRLDELKARVELILEKDNAFTIKDLDINGKILNDKGVPKSKAMGQILEYLLDLVLDNPKLNKEEILLKSGLEYYRENFFSKNS